MLYFGVSKVQPVSVVVLGYDERGSRQWLELVEACYLWVVSWASYSCPIDKGSSSTRKMRLFIPKILLRKYY